MGILVLVAPRLASKQMCQSSVECSQIDEWNRSLLKSIICQIHKHKYNLLGQDDSEWSNYWGPQFIRCFFSRVEFSSVQKSCGICSIPTAITNYGKINNNLEQFSFFGFVHRFNYNLLVLLRYLLVRNIVFQHSKEMHLPIFTE